MFGRARNCISGFAGSQAVPALPSARGSVYDKESFLVYVGGRAGYIIAKCDLTM
jgi:hypothetical protein